MTSIPRSIIEHHLNIDSSRTPVKQKKRIMAKERKEIINKEVEDFVRLGVMRATQFPKWIANPVLVKKANETMRMCVDFTDLSKACPKDNYPLLEIDNIYNNSMSGPINHRFGIPQAQSTTGLECQYTMSPVNHRVGIPIYNGSCHPQDGIPSSPINHHVGPSTIGLECQHTMGPIILKMEYPRPTTIGLECPGPLAYAQSGEASATNQSCAHITDNHITVYNQSNRSNRPLSIALSYLP
uniref:Uncharacterized protein n=1 Tax=Lactuca sativa TaxID=4236 RepID=A0A9R1WL52_LACSA|nr:hypothetical protein LSAT_V11C100005290 [Lactuca sativa]